MSEPGTGELGIPRSTQIQQAEPVTDLKIGSPQQVEQAMQPAVESSANPNTRLQQFLQQFNIPVADLPPGLKSQYKRLVAGQKDDRTDMTPKEYQESISQFIDGIRDEKVQLNLSPQALDNLTRTLALIQSGQIKPEQITVILRGYINDPVTNLPEADKKAAEAAIDDLEAEVKKPEAERDQKVVKEKTSTLMKILKSLGAIIMALLGFSIWRGFKEGSAQGPQR